MAPMHHLHDRQAKNAAVGVGAVGTCAAAVSGSAQIASGTPEDDRQHNDDRCGERHVVRFAVHSENGLEHIRSVTVVRLVSQDIRFVKGIIRRFVNGVFDGPTPKWSGAHSAGDGY